MKEIFYFVMLLLYLGAAAGAILLIADLAKKCNLPFLQSLLYYEILMMIFGLYSLLGMQVLDIITQISEMSSGTSQIIRTVIIYLGIPFYVTGWFMFIKHNIEIRGKSFLQKNTLPYFFFLLLLFLAYGILNAYSLRTHKILPFPAKITFLTLFFAVEIFFPLLVLLKNCGSANVYAVDQIEPNHRTKYFLWLFFTHCLSSIFILLIGIHPIMYAVFLLVYLVRDLPAIYYLRNVLSISYIEKNNGIQDDSGFDLFCNKFGISKREKEVLGLILTGYTNQEISEKLFITLQTVKDHNSRIYQKTGIKNRVQLMNLIAQMSK
jgi:DNA-binding CsgD family transcriptional regulator